MSTFSPLRAGVARTLITPPKGIYLIGYGDRYQGNIGVHDDLTATALVLDDRQSRVALVACDLLAINEMTAGRIRQAVGEQIEVLIACAHNHAGPIVYADRRSSRARQHYIDWMIERIAEAVRQAAEKLQPSRLYWASGQAQIAVNRREKTARGEVVIGQNPAGPVDRSLHVLRLENLTGEPLATLVNFATHGTVLGPQNRLVSADWMGAMRTAVEAELGGLVLFLQGATGDMNPRLNVQKEHPWEAVNELGREVAGQVIQACRSPSQPLQGQPLRLARQVAWLPLQARAETPQPPKTYRGPLIRYLKAPPWLGNFIVDPLLNRLYPWQSQIVARAGQWSVPLQVNALRIGPVGLLTLGCEVFTEIGMAAKALCPTPYTMFASLTDGCIGYLPTAQAQAEGGYEVELAPYFYRFPAPLAVGCDQLALSALREALGRIW